jgi:predicted metalloendopeptidase
MINRLTKKQIKYSKNKTKTKKQINNYKNITRESQMIICNKSYNTYNTFEDKIEELFKKNKINLNLTSVNLEKQFLSDLKKAKNSKGIKANQDFYSFVNEKWINEFELLKEQQYIIQVDNFRLIQDKVYRELINIIEDYISNPSTKNTKKTKCITNAYNSFKGYNTNQQTKCLAKHFLEYIDEVLKIKENLWETLGTLNKNEITSWGSPFVWTLNPDEKNPKIYKCYLEPPQVTLIDIDVYFNYDTDNKKEKTYKTNYRIEYFKYLDNLFTIAFGENHGFNVKDIFDTELELLNAMGCYLIKEENIDSYNIVTKDEALENFKFNWEEFCNHLGFTQIPNSFITSNINYLLCGTKLLLEKWNTSQWRTYWIYLYIREQCRWDEKGWQNYYNFHGVYVRAQNTPVDKYIKPVYGMGFLFNTFLTNEYISRYNNEQYINYVKTMAEDLKSVFIRIIQRNKWLQPSTKKKALDKLYNLKLTVGSPELLRNDPLLDYIENDPWGNINKMSQWRHAQAIKLVDKSIIDIPVMDWSQIPPKFIGSQAYLVNASYTPSENGIYIPLGYIQKPFVDLDERGMEYNLAYIGFTIAHEMSHALDDWGSKYDDLGRLNQWWTEKDIKHFKKIQKDVINQYQVFASYDGIVFDAEPSIGEDLADISGLAICQEYLRDFQLKNEDTLPIQSLSFEAFFIYFAIQSRQQISKKAILAQLKTNPHPLDKYRCNVPLSRNRIFRTFFDVKKGDNMWWNSLNTVWGD